MEEKRGTFVIRSTIKIKKNKVYKILPVSLIIKKSASNQLKHCFSYKEKSTTLFCCCATGTENQLN